MQIRNKGEFQGNNEVINSVRKGHHVALHAHYSHLILKFMIHNIFPSIVDLDMDKKSFLPNLSFD